MTIRDAITGRVVGEVYAAGANVARPFCAEWRNQEECRRELIITPGNDPLAQWYFVQEADARHELMAWDLERVGQEEK